MVQSKKMVYEIGKLVSVATDVLIACPKELQARFSVGNRVFQTKLSIEAEGQNLPCGVQNLNAEQLKANPGKFLMVTEGITRFEIARSLGKELLCLVHAPYSDATILERNIAANGPKSDLSVMDVCMIIVRSLAVGFTEPDIRKKLAFVAGRGKSELGKQRYMQYLRLKDLPAAIQMMAHNGEIRLDAVLHMTNAKRTNEQYERIVEQAKDTRQRLLKEQYDEDLVYIKRESDAALAAAFKGELGPEPVYIKRTRAKAEVSPAEPITTPEVKGAEADLDMEGKNKRKPAEVPAGAPLTSEEWLHLAQQVRERGGVMIEIGNLIEGVAIRKISEATFCEGLMAIVLDGGGMAHQTRRNIAEQLGTPQTAATVPTAAEQRLPASRRGGRRSANHVKELTPA